MRGDNRLVSWLQGANHRQLFFLVWAFIVGVTVMGMMSYYRRYTRRNFRAPGDRRGPQAPIVDLRKLSPNERKPVASGEDKARKG